MALTNDDRVLVPEPSRGADVLGLVGNAEDGVPLDLLIADLVHRAHLEAKALDPAEGLTGPCAWLGFAAEEGAPDGGREAFGEFLIRIRHPLTGDLLRAWDAASRPVAIVHWRPDPVALALAGAIERAAALAAQKRKDSLS